MKKEDKDILDSLENLDSQYGLKLFYTGGN